ncbi:hypothetical protein ACQEU3_42250 [Spirillospora sp. CA-253888]
MDFRPRDPWNRHRAPTIPSGGSRTGTLLDRRSYDILAAHWPNVPDEEGGAQINGMPKYVATRSAMTAAWNNTEVLVGDAARTVAELKEHTGAIAYGTVALDV